MCVHIAVTDGLANIAVWDSDEVSIRVSRGAPTGEALREVADILIVDLGAPASRGGPLRCFCGMRVELPRELFACVHGAEAG
ncbi:hypothetical protein ACIGMX_38130 [Streptomyces aquilus]|uniref:Uncharacterized protein n=1 Tax=Streptomyces aquilus TaxID=2548456 RepID=A0A3Q9BZK5_9ACTN|nr:hypothetical protein [Streptomyces aquilus]AZP20764.1 hypothetical protein EJC51_34645 [Streptomyces aquilus]